MNTTVAIAQQHPELAEQGIAQIRSVLTRSATDADFRRKLLDEPRAALHEALGAAFPERLDVRFVENTADATLVLPPFVDPDAELQESELEAVSGGSDPIAIGLMIFVGSMAVGAWAAQAATK